MGTKKPAVLVTGGLGYIGSHTSVVLAGAGYRPAIVDNLSNSKASVLARIRELAGNADIAFHQGNMTQAAQEAQTALETDPTNLRAQMLRGSALRRQGNLDEATIGGPELAVIAGPCGIESREQAMAIGERVARSGAKFFRGGAYKPRTSPYSFQGLGEDGLRIMAEIRQQFGMKIITEAIDHESLDLVEEYADMIQIGTRNMQNFSLLKRAGRAKKPMRHTMLAKMAAIPMSVLTMRMSRTS